MVQSNFFQCVQIDGKGNPPSFSFNLLRASINNERAFCARVKSLRYVSDTHMNFIIVSDGLRGALEQSVSLIASNA